jgi:hypothetical protein
MTARTWCAQRHGAREAVKPCGIWTGTPPRYVSPAIGEPAGQQPKMAGREIYLSKSRRWMSPLVRTQPATTKPTSDLVKRCELPVSRVRVSSPGHRLRCQTDRNGGRSAELGRRRRRAASAPADARIDSRCCEQASVALAAFLRGPWTSARVRHFGQWQAQVGRAVLLKHLGADAATLSDPGTALRSI